MNKINKKIEEIKRKSLTPGAVEYLDTRKDEEVVNELLLPFGKNWITTHDRNKFERWDIEGLDQSGKEAKIEVKSRTYGSKYTTWIIDTYKIDYLFKKFPDQNHYFVNCFKGEYHLYDAKFVATCKRVERWARFADGKQGMREYFEIPKEMFLIELKSQKKGAGAKLNKVFYKTYKRLKNAI